MSDEDEDWFEKALREEGESKSNGEDGGADAEPDEDATSEGGPGTAEDSGTESTATGADADADTDRDGRTGFGSNGGDGFGDAPSDGDDAVDFGSADAGGNAFGGGDPFDSSFADAMQGAPSPAGEQGDAFGEGFGTGEGDEFAGFDDFGGSTGFDEAEFDSDIERIDVGIEGLDEMILGGVPRRSLMTVIGSAGTGKTTFGLQFLNETLANDGSAVYITLEESREAILATAEEKGWPYREYEADDELAVVSMDPIEMANSLDSIRDDISRLVDEFGADRLVLDSVSLLEMMYDHPSKRRSEVFDFTRSLKEAGVTTMLTSEASEDNPYASRHGIVEYLTDAVFVLQYVRPSNFRETRLAVEIQKIRDANHSRETKPYEITNEGISVYRQANIF
uniref:KaiC domain-containing protein n=1 Tax=Halorarum salinum TaxID=2743089 RepID=UPI0037439A75